jgi:hypothetical protein
MVCKRKLTLWSRNSSAKSAVLFELLEEHTRLKKERGEIEDTLGSARHRATRSWISLHTGQNAQRSELCQLVAWIGLSWSKFYSWRDRYGKANEHNASVRRDHCPLRLNRPLELFGDLERVLTVCLFRCDPPLSAGEASPRSPFRSPLEHRCREYRPLSRLLPRCRTPRSGLRSWMFALPLFPN